MLKKQMLILALQSKITLLQTKFAKAQLAKDLVATVELDIEIKAYGKILALVKSGQFDA